MQTLGIMQRSFSPKEDTSSSGYLECLDCRKNWFFNRNTEQVIRDLGSSGLQIVCRSCGGLQVRVRLIEWRRTF